MVNRHARHLDAVEDAQQSQIRRRYELPGEARDAHTRPTLKTPRPRLGLGAIPRRLVDNREMLELPLDHRTAFVISQIDGKTPLRTLVDVTGLVPDELIALVERLIELKAIAVM